MNKKRLLRMADFLEKLHEDHGLGDLYKHLSFEVDQKLFALKFLNGVMDMINRGEKADNSMFEDFIATPEGKECMLNSMSTL